LIGQVAANVKYHGTSPWHLSTFEAKPLRHINLRTFLELLAVLFRARLARI